MDSIKNEEGFYLEYKTKYKIFHDLMTKRIRNVLLVSSVYDSFMLEEDGRLSDQIYEEFQNLNLRTFPLITRVSTVEEAFETMKKKEYDLVITMRRVGDIDAFSFGKKIKEISNTHVILLLNSVLEIKYLPPIEKREGIDRIFVWNGDSTIFVAIIKHLEDKLNVDHDTIKGEVRVFVFIDDSIRFYSLLLPEVYGEIMKQTHRLLTEGTNDYQDLLKMRIRPKILLAETYEEAMSYYDKYRDNMMGVISDIEFPKGGEIDKTAGFELSKQFRAELPNLPVVLLSSKEQYKEEAEKLGCFFIHKHSHGLAWDVRKWLLEHVGFGDFIFRKEDGKIVGKAKNILDFYSIVEQAPIESLYYHGKDDHFSNWLRARGEFEIANILKPRQVSEFEGEELRIFLLKQINKIVIEKTKGLINDFSRDVYHPDILFLRLRPGSLGGKGRGIAFLMFLLNSFTINGNFENIALDIPKTIVIGTDDFDRFMSENNLYDFSFSDKTDEEKKERFVKAQLSKSLKDDLKFLLNTLDGPLAVRSSSLLEDSAYQPFAGIFNTYMIPNNGDLKERLDQLCTAIKLVYVSPFLKLARSYAETLQQTVEESKMAVVIQSVVGKKHGDIFYPDFSGTASSNNFYPFGEYMKPEDKIAHVALGLGKLIVEGGVTTRFSPNFPKMNLYSNPNDILENSQRYFYAIDLKRKEFIITEEDPFVIKCGLEQAIKDKTIEKVADTYDFGSQNIETGYFGSGAPVITFNNQLKLDTFPLAQLITKILQLGEKSMGCPVEIEYAGNFKENSNEPDQFFILQIRPFLQQEMMTDLDLSGYNRDNPIVFSTKVSGNLVRDDIYDIIFVKPESFNSMKTLEILEEIDKLNTKLVQEGRQYILIGIGRWGTADRFLGIPAKWNNINGAKVIIETSLPNFKIDFSQGSHFFHNIVTANIGYLYIKFNSDKDTIDWEWLKTIQKEEDLEYTAHIRVKKPLIVRIDARNLEGLILKQD